MKERQEERLSPLPKIGEGFGDRVETPSYEEGARGFTSQIGTPSCFVHKRLKDIIIHNFQRNLENYSYLCIVKPIKVGFMKKYLIITIALIMPLFLFGQSYSALWKQVS